MEALDRFLCALSKSNTLVVLGGDFNVTLNIPSAQTQDLEVLLRRHGLYIANYALARVDNCLDTIAIIYGILRLLYLRPRSRTTHRCQ